MNLKALIEAGLSFKQLIDLGYPVKEIEAEDGAPEAGEGEKEEAEKNEAAAAAAADDGGDGGEGGEKIAKAIAAGLEKALPIAVERAIAKRDKPARQKDAVTPTSGVFKTLQTLKSKSLIDLGREVEAKTVQTVGKFWRAFAKSDWNEVSKVEAEILASNKGLSEGVDADGGYFVHPEFHREVFRLMEVYGVGRQLVRVLPMGSDVKNISSITSKPTAEMVGEASATSAAVKPGVGQITLVAKKAMANIIGTSELIEDNSTDIAIWDLMAELLAEAFALLEDQQIFTGTGIGNNHTGFMVSANSDINVVTMASGSTAFTDVDADDLLDLIDAVPESVAKVGQFCMHRSILSIVRKLQSTAGGYIFQNPGSDLPNTIWDRPYTLSEVMPAVGDTAVSTKFILYGDFRKAGVLGDRTGLQFKKMTEGTVNGVNLANTDQEALRGKLRFAFSVALGDALSVLRTAAS